MVVGVTAQFGKNLSGLGILMRQLRRPQHKSTKSNMVSAGPKLFVLKKLVHLFR